MSKFFEYLFVFLTTINFFLILLIYNLYGNSFWNTRHKSRIDDKKTSTTNRKTNFVTIETKFGKISGFKQNVDSKEILTFLGVPYAQPPIGKLRFRKPLTTFKWNSTFEASSWPSNCMQPESFLQLNNYNFSEDCLYLNLWTPKSRIGSLKPVLFLIHTGAFLFGSSTETKYDGLFLSSQADLIVVTFNFRLNFYGFFFNSSNSDIVPNVGMLDQVAALQWVHENIFNFGGDPERIIVLGQSSGALSAGMLITSSLSRYLVKQAILISGSPLQSSIFDQKETVSQFWSNFAKQLNCDQTNQVIDCIDSKIKSNRDSLLSMERVKKLSVSDALWVNLPVVIGGDFQPKTQLELIADTNFRNLTLLVGYTDDEGSWIASLDDPNLFGPMKTPNLSLAQASTATSRLLNIMENDKLIFNESQIINHYLKEKFHLNQRMVISESHKTDSYEKIILNRLIASVLADRYITCPIETFVDQILFQNKESKIYQYLWQYKGNPRTSPFWNTFSRVWCGQWMGTCHSFEMFAIFGVPFTQSELFDDLDRVVSKKSIEIIKYFAWKRKMFWPSIKQEEISSTKPTYVVDDSLNKFLFFNSNLKRWECKKFWKFF